MTCDLLREAALAVGLLLLSAPWALAQPASTPCAEIPDCADRFREAQRLSKSGAHDQALQGFLEIHRQYGDPTALYPIAVMLDRLGRPAEAVTAYERYVDAQVETDPDRLAKIQKQLERTRALANPPTPTPKVSTENLSTALQPGVVSVLPLQPSLLPAQHAVPLYKKGWFWAVIGSSVAAVAIGVGLGVGLSNRGPSLPDGVNTYVATF